MRRFVPVGIPGVLPLAVALIALTASAVAYFSAGGEGTASAAVTNLSAPTISAATASAGGTVALSWSGVTAPGEGTVSYYVTRDGEDAGGNCPTRSTPTTVKTCTDSSVPIGEHAYVVTAVWKTWTAASGAKTANVTVGAVAKFVIAGSTTTPTAGGSTNLTITAKDVNNSTVTTYAGSHTLVFSGASASPGGTAPTVANSSGSNIAFGSSTVLTFTAGVASVSSTKNGVLKIYRSGTASIVATEGSITTPAPLVLTVSPAATSKFVVAAATTTPAAGAVDNLTITAQDTYGNTATSYTGSHNLVFSGASASPAGNIPTVSDSDGDEVAFGAAAEIEFNAGVASPAEGDNGAMKLYKSGAVSLKATEGSLTNTALAITVSAGAAAKLAIAAATLTPVAAAADILTITAQDTYGNTATGYTGSKNLTFSGATASPSGAAPTVANSSGTAISFGSATAITFTSGVATATSTKNGTLKLNRAGAASLTATDGTISSSAALNFTVSAGTATRWALANPVVGAGTIGSPCLFTCAITALGNSGTVSANVSVTDGVGNVVSELGSGHVAKVTATGTAGSTVVGTPLEIPATGPAASVTQFTYTAPASGAFSNTLTVAASAGTAYTTATATTSK
jgi:hypothetical protein